MVTEFSVEQAQERLPELFDWVECGEDIVLIRFGAPAVRLQPARQQPATREAGHGALGAMWLAPVAWDDTCGGSGGSTFDLGTYYGAEGVSS